MSEPLPGMPEPEYESPGDWTMQTRIGGEVYPFIEDEDLNITGLGHQDLAAFAAAVARYDAECGLAFGHDEAWDAESIRHHWMAPDADSDEFFHECEPDALGAIAVTTLWGAR